MDQGDMQLHKLKVILQDFPFQLKTEETITRQVILMIKLRLSIKPIHQQFSSCICMLHKSSPQRWELDQSLCFMLFCHNPVLTLVEILFPKCFQFLSQKCPEAPLTSLSLCGSHWGPQDGGWEVFNFSKSLLAVKPSCWQQLPEVEDLLPP